MELCSEGHGEICYETRDCPACEALAELSKEKDSEINNLERRITKLETELENMESNTS